jgi:hypothetical protein
VILDGDVMRGATEDGPGEGELSADSCAGRTPMVDERLICESIGAPKTLGQYALLRSESLRLFEDEELRSVR